MARPMFPEIFSFPWKKAWGHKLRGSGECFNQLSLANYSLVYVILVILKGESSFQYGAETRLQTVCGFIFPVIRAGRSLSLMEMVQSAFFPGRNSNMTESAE